MILLQSKIKFTEKKLLDRELSQDAFICWLVSYANYPKNEVLNRAAKDFIALLYNLTKGPNAINGTNVELIDNPKRQHRHTDVYFQAVINGRRISFIVEDKTYTSHHSNQLSRYREDIKKKDNIKEEEIVCIYFKTGYIYPCDEKAKTEHGYEILDYKRIHDFLQDYKTDNLIFESYKEYIKEEFCVPYTTWTRKLLEENEMTVLWEGKPRDLLSFSFVQWEFMQKLMEKCPRTLCSGEIKEVDRIYKGTNRSGDPWTQMWFIELESVYSKDLNESVFYRLDKRKNPKANKREYYLSIRQYAKVKDNPVAKQKKLERLAKYKSIFGDAIIDLFGDKNNCPLKFCKTYKKSGANESEIATLFFNSASNSPNAVLEQIGKIHEQFVKRIQLTDTITKS